MTMDTTTMTLTIDGREVPFDAGMTILEAADAAGVDIPRLCAYPGIEAFGGCRLCIVELEGVRGYPTACTQRAAAGQVVHTDSDGVASLRRSTLALLLTKHPTGCLMCLHDDDCLDHHGCHARRSGTVTGCRFCPNDAQCELQRLVERCGLDDMPFPVEYRGLPVDRRNPFLDIDPNLCVLCGRCTRVCAEVRGAEAIGLIQRGEDTRVETIGNVPRLETTCQFCGSCVDACPTGSLAERVNKWVGAPTGAVTTTCPFCSLGCALELRTRDGQVIGARPAGEPLCSLGRFAPVETVLPEERVTEPMVRHGERLVPATWDEALAAAAAGLGAAPVVYASRDLTCEDLTAVAGLAGAIGVTSLWTDATALPDVPRVASLDELAAARRIVTVDTDLRFFATPVLLALGAAVREGARLVAVEPFASEVERLAVKRLRPEPGREDEALAAAADALPGDGPAVIVWGAGARGDVAALAARLGATVLPLAPDGNLAPAPMPAGPARPAGEALLSFGRPPLAERPTGCWVAWTHTLDDLLRQADVILPATVFSEQAGIRVDVFGRTRAFVPAVAPADEAKDAAWVCDSLVTVMAIGCGLPHQPEVTEHEESSVRQAVPDAAREAADLVLVREANVATYLGVAMSERVPGLIPLAREGRVEVHPDDAARLGLTHGAAVRLATADGEVTGTVQVTAATPPGSARLVAKPGMPGLGPCAARVVR